MTSEMLSDAVDVDAAEELTVFTYAALPSSGWAERIMRDVAPPSSSGRNVLFLVPHPLQFVQELAEEHLPDCDVVVTTARRVSEDQVKGRWVVIERDALSSSGNRMKDGSRLGSWLALARGVVFVRRIPSFRYSRVELALLNSFKGTERPLKLIFGGSFGPIDPPRLTQVVLRQLQGYAEFLLRFTDISLIWSCQKCGELSTARTKSGAPILYFPDPRASNCWHDWRLILTAEPPAADRPLSRQQMHEASGCRNSTWCGHRTCTSPCSALIGHGPGHQSLTHCTKERDHDVHSAPDPRGGTFHWRGELGFSTFFDESPL